MNLIAGLTIPLLGTILGAACVFFVRQNLPRQFMRGLDGFAAGVMVAAAVWSLLVPALEQVSGKGAFQKLIDVMPHLYYFLQSDGLTTIIKNLPMFAWQLLDTIRPIVNLNVDDLLHLLLTRLLGYV